MFENSLVVSQVNRTSSTQRWTAFASMGLQFAIASLIIALPLLHPERLVFQMNAPRLLMPLPAKPPIPVEHVQTSSASSSMAAPVAEISHQARPLLPQLLPITTTLPPSLPFPLPWEQPMECRKLPA